VEEIGHEEILRFHEMVSPSLEITRGSILKARLGKFVEPEMRSFGEKP
jgi:hypothetical protein